MSDELDGRVARALCAEAQRFTLTVTASDVEQRLARSSAMPWLIPAVAAVAAAAVILLALLSPGRSPVGDHAAPLLPTDPCALLTPEQVASVIDGEVWTGRPPRAEEYIGDKPETVCVLHTETRHGTLYITVDRQGADDFVARREDDDRHPDLAALSGLGDEAFLYSPISIDVRIGDGYFSISSQYQYGPDDRDRATADVVELARLALRTLGYVGAEPLPATTCAEWAALSGEEQVRTAGILVSDRREAARRSQQLPADADDRQLAEAVNSTIGKLCQSPMQDRPLTDIIDAVYPYTVPTLPRPTTPSPSPSLSGAELEAAVDRLFAHVASCEVTLAGRKLLVTYPASWSTNAPSGDDPGCLWFGPDPMPAQAAGSPPTGAAITLGAAGGPPEPPLPGETVTSRRDLTVASLPARRVETVDVDTDRRRLSYSIAASGETVSGPTLVATTSSDAAGNYDLNVAVLDRMMDVVAIVPNR